MKKVLFLIISMVCAVTGAWADPSGSLENGTSGTFFLYDSGTPQTNNLSANSGYKALIGATTYKSGKKWSQIEENEIGNNVQYQNDQNWLINNANNGNVGDEVAVANGEYEYQYYTKVVTENGTAGTWTGSSTTAPEGVSNFIDINTNQVSQYQNENMSAGTYYYRVTVPKYNYYRKVRYWEQTTLTGQQNITYYEAGTDVSTLSDPANDEGKLAIGGEYWYADNGVWIGGASDGDYIQLKQGETDVYDVHVTKAGSLAAKFAALSPKPADGATFVFDKDCVNFTAEDLKALALAEVEGSRRYFYIDLYNVDLTLEENANIETAIEDAVTGLDTSKEHYKGLLLPKNPQEIGTGLILNAGTSPCSEFIAYNAGTTTVLHVYNSTTASTASSTYADNLTTAKNIMDVHTKIADNTTAYLVSTNSQTPISNVKTIKGTSTTATVIHTYNNEMVKANTNPTKPTIEVMPGTPGAYETVNNATNVRNTPQTEVLKFSGNIAKADILAVNSFTKVDWDSSSNSYVEVTPKEYNGPRVLDLSGVTELTATNAKDWLSELDNPKIEYIILPAGMDETAVCDYDHEKLPALKCVISTNKSTDDAEDKVLTAYVRTAGSLAEARCLATGNDDGSNNTFQPSAQGLTTVKLSGNLNAGDLATSGTTSGLKDEYSTITSIDLEDAHFANINDMKLGEGGAGFNNNNAKLKEVKLPTSETVIPESFLYGVSTVETLHIPYNYTTIKKNAFWESGINHITTEDANHVVIDNGDHTYTLSANIKVLGDPNATESTAVFPGGQKVHDVYCLATETPTCYAHTFHSDIVYGNGGANDGPYCKEKYISTQNGTEKVIAMLHFPSKASFTNEADYLAMEKKYTDPTRAYTKKDQTGAVDANGDPLLWPDQSELKTSRDMALAGYIWTDYDYVYPADGHLESATLKTGAVQNGNFGVEYAGWHEFVLSQASYVDPDETVTEDDVIERKYEDAGWYTICIPYNLTRSQVLRMMGVPQSTDKIKNYLASKDDTNTTTYAEVTDDMMPDIRQLKAVTRKKKGENDSQNQVKFFLTKNLYGYDNNKSTHTSYLDFTEIDGNKTSFEAVDADGTNNSDPICLVGGRPYIIKIYKRQGVTISQQNIGKYIMTHYGDELGLSASCLNNGSDYYEQLLDENETPANKKLVTLQFVKPYEKHLVQAVVDGESMTPVTYTEGGTTYRYYYAMQGQFWDQDLPEYCFYISKGKWFHYMDKSKNYKWNAYKCVIMATPLEVVASNPVIPGTADQVVEKQKIDAVTKVIGDLPIPEADKPTVKAEVEKGTAGALSWTSHWGVGFRWYPFCWFPQPETDTTDLLKSNFRLGFMGRDDDDFDKRNMARYIFDFEGDSVVEYDEDGNETTAIDMLDGEPQLTGKSDKVYSISGQYMGKTTENLPKGIYVVSGRKIVVD